MPVIKTIPVIFIVSFQLFFMPPLMLQGQSADSILNTLEGILTKTKNHYGPDEVLENGRLYTPEHSKARGNPYFISSGWMPGSLIIKGEIYPNIWINYDVSIDQVILKKEIRNQENHFPIILNRNFVDHFSVLDHQFVNLEGLVQTNELSGYAELVYEGKAFYIIKHKKEFLNQYTQANPFGYYSKLNSTLYAIDQGSVHRLGSKKVLMDYFAPHQKEIKRFMRKQHIRYKKASHVQFSELLKYADELSDQ